MFYDLGYRVGSIHVPRTGGTAISIAFRPFLGVGSGWDLGRLRHLPASAMVRLLGIDCEGMRFFAVHRPFKEIKASLQKLIDRDRNLLESGQGHMFSPSWKEVLRSPEPLEYMFALTMWPTYEQE
ncbi:hypothetical protein [Thermogutta sp.]|uniref:hypothetical protein n=1 Tax=Thermogutta sp. TaxID=1962930 RepID=UPI00321FB29F